MADYSASQVICNGQSVIQVCGVNKNRSEAACLNFFDTESMQYTGILEGGALPVALFSTAQVDDAIIVAGGTANTQDGLPSTECFSLSKSSQVQKIAQMKIARKEFAMVYWPVTEKLYAFGGARAAAFT
jgi:hypothetical protein